MAEEFFKLTYQYRDNILMEVTANDQWHDLRLMKNQQNDQPYLVRLVSTAVSPNKKQNPGFHTFFLDIERKKPGWEMEDVVVGEIHKIRDLKNYFIKLKDNDGAGIESFQVFNYAEGYNRLDELSVKNVQKYIKKIPKFGKMYDEYIN